MKTVLIAAGFASLAIASPASANHLANLLTPYDSRGECESAIADFNSDDREMLLTLFPNFFVSNGDVASFLTRAFRCELSSADGQWYITNHRGEVLASEWYLRRHD